MKSMHRRPITITAMICVLLLLAVFLSPASAKRGGDDIRSEFRGIVTEMPAGGFSGEWVIGGRVVLADPATEFDQAEGPLGIGGCAKVKIRNGRVHEIDSEPLNSCK